jgi:MFS family permease
MQAASSDSRMTPVEIRATLSLGSIFALRMLGLFLILPVFSVHAVDLRGGDNLALVGLALGIYGLTQGMLQIPYGMAADRYGRKRVIVIGLVLFALGSFIAAAADDIWLTIVGRFIQGAGAISAAVMALAADLTREEHRTKTMAVIGASIGLVFAVSLVLAPAMYRWIGMAGIFAFIGVLATLAIWIVLKVVPPEPPMHVHAGADLSEASLGAVLRHRELQRLNIGMFILHLAQMAMFIVVPRALVADGGLALESHWMVYLPVVLVSFALMVPPLLAAEKRRRMRGVFLASVALLGIVQIWLAGWATSVWSIGLALLVYFVGFNLLEALLPSLVSRHAPPRAKGTALGVYNTMQALGLFTGGVVGGWLAQQFGAAALYYVNAALILAWLLLAWPMRAPPPVSTRTVPVGAAVDAARLRAALLGVPGVREAIVVPEQGVAHLQVHPGWDEGTVMKLVEGRA